MFDQKRLNFFVWVLMKLEESTRKNGGFVIGKKGIERCSTHTVMKGIQRGQKILQGLIVIHPQLRICFKQSPSFISQYNFSPLCIVGLPFLTAQVLSYFWYDVESKFPSLFSLVKHKRNILLTLIKRAFNVTFLFYFIKRQVLI